MASTDATALPVKGQAFRVTFPIFDKTGALVTGATGLDSEVSKDAGTFADCTNEATEIATSSGVYYLDLTATEMTADTVAIIVKTTTTDAKTTPIVLYPQEAGDIIVDAKKFGGTTVTGRDLGASVLLSPGTGTGQISLTAGAVTFGNTSIGTVTNLTNLPTAPTDWISAAAVSAAAVSKIQAGLSTYAGGDTSGTTTLLSRLTSTRAGLLDNLDAAVSTRSTYAGGDTSGTTTLLGRLTSTRAGLLDNLDAPISGVAATILVTPTHKLATDLNGYAYSNLKLINDSSDATAGLVTFAIVVGADTAGTNAMTGLYLMGTDYQTPRKLAATVATGDLADISATRAAKIDNLDATVSSRSTYAGADTAGTTTLLGRLTATRAGNLDNLDAAISSRMATFTLPTNFSALGITVGGHITTVDTLTNAPGDTSGTTTLLGRLTSTRATALDNLDATISSRSTFAGGAVASVTAAVTVGTNNDKTGYALSTAGVTAVQSGLSTLDAAGVRTAVGLASANLDTQLGTLLPTATFNASDAVTGGTRLLTMLETPGAGVYRYTTASLANAPSGGTSGGLTVGQDATLTAIAERTANLPDDPAATADVTGVPEAVWTYGTRTLSSFGTLAADTATAIWSAAKRTLTRGKVR